MQFKISRKSEDFLKKYIPKYDSLSIGELLTAIYDFIDDYGFEPPEYIDYNELGRTAQAVYDELL